MCSRRFTRLFPGSATFALLGVIVCAPESAYATCGDYLLHGDAGTGMPRGHRLHRAATKDVSPVSANTPSRSRPTTSEGRTPLRPACNGPGCRRNPASPGTPAAPLPKIEVSRETFGMTASHLVPNPESHGRRAVEESGEPARGHHCRIDRPPQV